MLTAFKFTCGFSLLAASALGATPASAQFGNNGLPSDAVIANADKYDPPKLTEYAAKLASQPDMNGSWTAMIPKEAGAGPTYDPANTFWPSQPVKGEAQFGPMPGTYIKDIPYNAEYQKKYQELVKETTEGKSRDAFPACVPYGAPRMIGASPVPFDIIQAPEVMSWYNDYGRTERKIFLDGRQHPTTPTPTGGFGPSYSGHSIGHWEGNTLVVDTVGFLPGYFDETPAPHSDQLHMVERLRLIDTHILEDQMTFTDPVMLARPWVVTRYFQRTKSVFAPPLKSGDPIVRTFIDLNDRPCVANVEMDENGFQRALLPAEMEARDAAAKAKPGKKRK